MLPSLFGFDTEMGLGWPFSSSQIRSQSQQRVVRGRCQHGAQAIHVSGIRQADKELRRGTAQETIQCNTQDKIAGAA